MGEKIETYINGRVNVRDVGTTNASEVSNTVLSGYTNGILSVDVITDGTISGKKFYKVKLDSKSGIGRGECIYRTNYYSLKESKGGEYMSTLYGENAPLESPGENDVYYRIVLREKEDKSKGLEAILEKSTSPNKEPEGDDVVSWRNVFVLYGEGKNQNPNQLCIGVAVMPDADYDSLPPFTVVSEQDGFEGYRKYMKVPKKTSVISNGESIEVENASEDGWYEKEYSWGKSWVLEDNQKYYLIVRLVGGKLKATIETEDEVGDSTTGCVAIQNICETNGEKELPKQNFTGKYPSQYVGTKKDPLSATTVPQYKNGAFHPRFLVYVPEMSSVHDYGRMIQCEIGYNLYRAEEFGYPEGWCGINSENKDYKFCRLAVWFDKGAKQTKATVYMAKDKKDCGEIENILAVYDLFEIKDWFDQDETENWNGDALIKTEQVGPILHGMETLTAFAPKVLRASASSIDILFENCHYYWKNEFRNLSADQYLECSEVGHVLLKVNSESGAGEIIFYPGNQLPSPSEDYCYFALGRVSHVQSDTDIFPYRYMPNSGIPRIGPSFKAGENSNIVIDKDANSEMFKLNFYYK